MIADNEPGLVERLIGALLYFLAYPIIALTRPLRERWRRARELRETEHQAALLRLRKAPAPQQKLTIVRQAEKPRWKPSYKGKSRTQ